VTSAVFIFAITITIKLQQYFTTGVLIVAALTVVFFAGGPLNYAYYDCSAVRRRFFKGNKVMHDGKILNLVVVAHPDDEILGFGATGAHLVRKGELVQPVILCGNVDARTSRPANEELHADMSAANELLGFRKPVLGSFPNIRMNTVDHIVIVQFIERQIELFQPARIFTHHVADLNDDHAQVSNACMAASRYFQRRANIRPLESLSFIEILSSTDWSFASGAMSFSPNCFVDVTDSLEIKIEALSKYRGVMRKAPHPRSPEIIRGHAAYRGGQCGKGYAEAFQTVFRNGF
jgi:LmbE family N-acetylglucosaminyl deacetylase